MTTAEAIAQIRDAAHFYMSHKMREYPHPNAPEITMAEHKRSDDCPGCRAEAALDFLEAEIERLRSNALEEPVIPGYGSSIDYDTQILEMEC